VIPLWQWLPIKCIQITIAKFGSSTWLGFHSTSSQEPPGPGSSLIEQVLDLHIHIVWFKTATSTFSPNKSQLKVQLEPVPLCLVHWWAASARQVGSSCAWLSSLECDAILFFTVIWMFSSIFCTKLLNFQQQSGGLLSGNWSASIQTNPALKVWMGCWVKDCMMLGLRMKGTKEKNP